MTLGVRERIRVPWPAARMTAVTCALSAVRLCQLEPLSPTLLPMGGGGVTRSSPRWGEGVLGVASPSCERGPRIQPRRHGAFASSGLAVEVDGGVSADLHPALGRPQEVARAA